jgi:Xaa-Pro aminopeptidase
MKGWKMNRISTFQEIYRQKKLDAFFATKLVDIRYLCGFSGSNATMWLSPERNCFFTDFRYKTQSAEQIGDKAEIFITSVEKDLIKLMQEQNLVRKDMFVGFDPDCTTYSQFNRLKSHFPDTNWIPVRSPLNPLKSAKDAGELELIKIAARIAADSLVETLPLLRPGITEREFAAELSYRLQLNGSEKDAFDTIVVSGPRAAMPHGTPSGKTIVTGEMITVDFGATYKGYCSDITRTFFLGTPDPKFIEIYNIVLNSQKAAFDKIKAGVIGKDVDAASREFITNAGYGEYFQHGLGHGIGLLVHDCPSFSPTEDKQIPAGAVLTVEPGIYIPDWGGIRIEDDIAVTETGYECLTCSLPKDLKDITIPVAQ